MENGRVNSILLEHNEDSICKAEKRLIGALLAQGERDAERF